MRREVAGSWETELAYLKSDMTSLRSGSGFLLLVLLIWMQLLGEHFKCSAVLDESLSLVQTLEMGDMCTVDGCRKRLAAVHREPGVNVALDFIWILVDKVLSR